jgi:hypothetical protein
MMTKQLATRVEELEEKLAEKERDEKRREADRRAGGYSLGVLFTIFFSAMFGFGIGYAIYGNGGLLSVPLWVIGEIGAAVGVILLIDNRRD